MFKWILSAVGSCRLDACASEPSLMVGCFEYGKECRFV
jgi:hypothetical protein